MLAAYWASVVLGVVETTWGAGRWQGYFSVIRTAHVLHNLPGYPYCRRAKLLIAAPFLSMEWVWIRC